MQANKLTVNPLEYATEFRILWALSVLVSVLVVAVSFLLTPPNLDSGVMSFLSIPHDHCLFCGMSHSMIMMSDWRFGEAFSWNAGGPFLYAIMVANSLGGLVVVFRNTIRKNLKT